MLPKSESGLCATLPGESLALVDELTAWLVTGDLIEGLYDVTSRLAEAFSFSRCSVFMRHSDDPQIVFLLATSDDVTLSRYPLDLRKYPELAAVFNSRDVLFIDDVATSPLLGSCAPAVAESGGRCLLVVPIVIDRRAVGALMFRSGEPHHQPDQDQLMLLRLVAQLIALVLRACPLEELLREQTQQVSILEQTSRRRRRVVEQYREVFESFTDPIAVVDGDGTVLFINHAAEQMTGYSRSSVAGRPLSELVVHYQPEKLAQIIEMAEKGQQLARFDVRLVTTSGEQLLVDVSISTVLMEQGAVVLSLRDVTVARALEEELHQTKDFLERLIDSAVDAIVATDLRGNIILFNPAAERLFGYRADEVIGRLPVWKLYPEERVAREVMARLRSPDHGPAGRLGPERREILTRDGVPVPVSLTASIIYEDGRESASVAILSDLRERLHMEQRLAQAQEKLQNSEKHVLIADLAGTAAHELNQPLTSVVGYAELLKKRMAADDSNTHAVDIILREAERMAQIVRKIGQITRYETKPYIGSATMLDLDKSTTED